MPRPVYRLASDYHEAQVGGQQVVSWRVHRRGSPIRDHGESECEFFTGLLRLPQSFDGVQPGLDALRQLDFLSGVEQRDLTDLFQVGRAPSPQTRSFRRPCGPASVLRSLRRPSRTRYPGPNHPSWDFDASWLFSWSPSSLSLAGFAGASTSASRPSMSSSSEGTASSAAVASWRWWSSWPPSLVAFLAVAFFATFCSRLRRRASSAGESAEASADEAAAFLAVAFFVAFLVALAVVAFRGGRRRACCGHSAPSAGGTVDDDGHVGLGECTQDLLALGGSHRSLLEEPGNIGRGELSTAITSQLKK